MKQEGYIILINDTDYDWIMTRNLRYRMKQFCFPECIGKYSEAVAYIEWEDTIDYCEERLAAAICYELSGTESSFMLMAYETGLDKDIKVYFKNLSARGLNDKETISLGWVNGGTLRLILSEPEEGELHRLEIESNYHDFLHNKEESSKSQTVKGNPIKDEMIGKTEGKIRKSSVVWMGNFNSIGSIDNLSLTNDCYWEECEILLKRYTGSIIKCTLTLIIGSELKEMSIIDDIYLNTGEEKHLLIPIKNQVSLVLVGTVSNLDEVDTRIDITLTGICRDSTQVG